MEVYVDDESKLTLHGLQQHYVKLKDNEKNRKLFELLDVLEFNQVVIFVKSVQRCMALSTLLGDQNFPAIAIHRSMTQEERLSRYQQFKDFKKRILVATDLFGRGMDIERVNIVFNYDMPENSDSYLHRVARAGRFGTKGLGITFVCDETDAKVLNDVQDRFDVSITPLPDEIDLSSYSKRTAEIFSIKLTINLTKILFQSKDDKSRLKEDIHRFRPRRFQHDFTCIRTNRFHFFRLNNTKP